MTAEEILLEANALRGQRKFDEADALLRGAVAANPDHADLHIQYAMVAAERRSAADQLVRWEAVLQKFPDQPLGYWKTTEQLIIRFQLDRAESVIAEGHARFPTDRFVLWQYALVAHRKRDWPEAIRRWEAAAALYPDMPQIVNGLGAVRLASSLEEADETPHRLPPPVIHNVEDLQLRDMMMRFEGLGNNCEFGIVQRQAGAEPMGLMRWSNTGPGRLTKMLLTRCAGVGSPEFLRLHLNPDGEYGLADTRYFGMHTFIYAGEQEEGKLLVSLQRRLKFLSEKLIADLETGEKTFVYKQHTKPITEDEMQSLVAAMRTYGNARLFCVQKPLTPAQDGKVEYRGNGLFVGYMSALDNNPVAGRERLDLWIDLLRAVEAHA